MRTLIQQAVGHIADGADAAVCIDSMLEASPKNTVKYSGIRKFARTAKRGMKKAFPQGSLKYAGVGAGIGGLAGGAAAYRQSKEDGDDRKKDALKGAALGAGIGALGGMGVRHAKRARTRAKWFKDKAAKAATKAADEEAFYQKNILKWEKKARRAITKPERMKYTAVRKQLAKDITDPKGTMGKKEKKDLIQTLRVLSQKAKGKSDGGARPRSAAHQTRFRFGA